MQTQSMRKIAVVLWIVFMGLAAESWGEGYEAALEAYRRGDYEAALGAYNGLAELGDANAQNDLGVMHSLGEGVTRNALEAMKWYRLAAEQGHVEAQISLGWMFVYGYGESNCTEGVNWQLLASEQRGARSIAAERGISRSRAPGQGIARSENSLDDRAAPQACIPQDYALAYMWLSLAAEKGAENALTARDIVVKKMTPEEIAAGRRLATICVGKNYKDCY